MSTVSAPTLRIMLISAVALVFAGVVAVVTDDDAASVSTDSPASTSTTIVFTDPSDDDDGDTVDDGADSPTSGGAGPDADAASDGGAGNDPGAPTTAAGDSPRTTVADAGDAPASTTSTSSPPTTVPTSSPSTTAPGTTTSPNTTPTPAGSHTYATSGTVTFGPNSRDLKPESTLTVGAADGDGRWVQVREIPDEEDGGTVTRTTFRATPAGIELEQIILESDFGISNTTVLTATVPFLIIPADATTGTVTKGRLEGGGIIANVTFTIVDHGTEVTTSRLVAELSGDAEGTQTTEMTSRTADRIPVEEKVSSDVSSRGFRITTNYQATLRS